MQNCKYLRSINLSNNDIGKHIFRENASCDNESDVVEYCPAMITMCETIAQNSCIKELFLNSNHIDSYGMLVLSKMLNVNTSLEHLSIANNPITSGAWGTSALAESIKKNTTLISLDVTNWYDFFIKKKHDTDLLHFFVFAFITALKMSLNF